MENGVLEYLLLCLHFSDTCHLTEKETVWNSLSV
jgi:hypothetical protein